MFENLECGNHVVVLFTMEAMCVDRLERHANTIS
jgi:hypothetical protein